MKREDVKKLLGESATDETVDKLMALHGKGVEKANKDAETAQAEAANYKTQLDAANQQIESFKGMKKPEEVDAAVGEWKTKYEQADADHKAQLAKIEEDGVLDGLLKETYKVSDMVAVKAHLKRDELTYNAKAKTFAGLEEQIKPIKENHAAYFSDFVEPPRIVAGGNNQPINGDAVVNAARKAAGLSTS